MTQLERSRFMESAASGAPSQSGFCEYDDAFLGREDAGLFYGGGFDQLGMQAVMLLIIIAWVTITTAILFTVIKATIGLRVQLRKKLKASTFSSTDLLATAATQSASAPEYSLKGNNIS